MEILLVEEESIEITNIIIIFKIKYIYNLAQKFLIYLL